MRSAFAAKPLMPLHAAAAENDVNCSQKEPATSRNQEFRITME